MFAGMYTQSVKAWIRGFATESQHPEPEYPVAVPVDASPRQIGLDGWVHRKKGMSNKFERLQIRLQSNHILMQHPEDTSWAVRFMINCKAPRFTVGRTGPPGLPHAETRFLEIVTAEKRHVVRFDSEARRRLVPYLWCI